jgi:hypothetical protein
MFSCDLLWVLFVLTFSFVCKQVVFQLKHYRKYCQVRQTADPIQFSERKQIRFLSALQKEKLQGTSQRP